MSSMRPGDWRCPQCATINFASRNDCRNARHGNACFGVRRPSNAGPPASAPKPGDWKCDSCGTNNFASKTVCHGCQRPKPSQVVLPPAGYVPPPSAVFAAAHAQSKVAEPSTNVKVGDWKCNLCGANNFASRAACFKCRAPKGAVAPPSPTSIAPSTATVSSTSGQQQQPAVPRPGDWACPKCTFSNFGSRAQCMMCGAARPGQTSSTAGAPASDGPSGSVESPSTMKGFSVPKTWISDGSAIGSGAVLADGSEFQPIAATLWSKFSKATAGKPIRQVLRVENVALWHGYCAEVQRLVAKYPNQAAPMSSDWEPKTLRTLDDTYHINESYLMHGTSRNVANLISEGGFDPSHSGESAGALFGQGTYFSDSLNKVMSYSSGCVVVARVALGEVAEPPHAGNTSSYRRPPTKPGTNTTEEFDSLVASAHSGLKEYIVYRHTKAYPEYLIFHD